MIIALTGPKGSGKDTVGELIKEMYPQLSPKTIAFADPIKKQIAHIFNLTSIDQYDEFKRSTLLTFLTQDMHYPSQFSVEGRRVVREIGMLMRSYDEKQFTNYVVGEIRYEPMNFWVVTDLRFDNEFTVLKTLGAKIIKIIRPHYSYDGHITERAFDDHLVDKLLMNDGNLEYLKIRVKSVIDSLLEENK